MDWSKEAENAVKKVPFFVRKRVRTRIEKEAREAGKRRICLADVKTTQARYLKSMASEIKGYQVDACFGPGGCPNRAVIGDGLVEQIEGVLKQADLLAFLKHRVKGELKFHHEFRVTLSDCPNACSQPQIKDIGIIGACTPMITGEECSRCEACVDACKEDAINLSTEGPYPQLDDAKCLYCAQCMQVCPTGTLVEGTKGFRVHLGGKLGRHPRLAREMPGIYSEQQVLEIIMDCIDFYKENSRNGERFSHILKSSGFDDIVKRHTPIG
jgi:dissimilatory sulfite reductase (desulfoviridin) alpha/beta subunit